VGDVIPGGAVDTYLAGRKHAGHLMGGGPFLKRDTRDDFIFPRRGSFSLLNVLASRRFVTSDYDYEIYELDQRNYFALGQRTVLAFEGYARYAPGRYIPLDDLSALGGAARLRGYFEGRYRDRAYLMSQLELRVYLVWRASLAPFFAAGDVFPSLDAITLSHLKAAGGLGLRINLKKERAFNLRVDYAQSSTSSGIYINLGEAF
jgi:outer membrane protein assembly factor BamA